MKINLDKYIECDDLEYIILQDSEIKIKEYLKNDSLEIEALILRNEKYLFKKREFTILNKYEEGIFLDNEAKKNFNILTNYKVIIESENYFVDIRVDKEGKLKIAVRKESAKEYIINSIYLDEKILKLQVNIEKVDKADSINIVLNERDNDEIIFTYKKIKENLVHFAIDLSQLVKIEEISKIFNLRINGENYKLIVENEFKLEEKTIIKDKLLKRIIVKSKKDEVIVLTKINTTIKPRICNFECDDKKLSIVAKLNSNIEEKYIDNKNISILLRLLGPNNTMVDKELILNKGRIQINLDNQDLKILKQEMEGTWSFNIVLKQGDNILELKALRYENDLLELKRDILIYEDEAINRIVSLTAKNRVLKIKLNNEINIKEIRYIQFLKSEFKIRYRTKEDISSYLETEVLNADIKLKDKVFKQRKIKKIGKKTFEVIYATELEKNEVKKLLEKEIEILLKIDNKKGISRIRDMDQSKIFDDFVSRKKDSKKYKKLCAKLYMKVLSKLKVKKKRIMFESFLGRNISGNPKYLYNYLVEQGLDKEYELIWILNNLDEEIEGKHKKVKRRSLRYFYYMATSGYWIFNCRQADEIKKRKETVYLQTWHGTPLKKLGMDMQNVSMAGQNNIEDYKKKFLNNSRRWDYLISQNNYSTEIFKSAFAFDKKMLDYGYPANDILYNKNTEIEINKIKDKLKIPKDKKIILYAPTWRDDNFYKKGHYKMKMELELNKIQKELGDEYIVLLRMHYLITNTIKIEDYKGFAYDFSQGFDIQELYLVSDLLITDYSSVMFDFANLKRDTIFYTYDIENYRDSLRGFYFNFEDEAPGPLVKTTEEVIENIKNIRNVRLEYSEKKQKFYKKFCHIDDGQAAKRIFEKILK